MAFSSKRGRFAESEGSIAEINVTPFVDVVLVLLIIFMITAGVVELGMRVSTPATKAAAAQSKPAADEFAIVQVASDGSLFLKSEQISIYDVVPRVLEGGQPERGVYIQAHRSAPWDTVAQVLAEVGSSGMKINLVSTPLRRNPRGRRR